MSNIVAIPELSILEWVDGLLRNTGEYVPGPIDILKVNDFLNLRLHDYDLREIKKEVAPGEQLELRGILDINEKAVILDINEPNLHRKLFSNGHEIGHYVLPTHREILYQCSELDMKQSTHDIMEIEANQFSAHLLFKGTLFQEYTRDFHEAASTTVSHIASQFETSLTSTCRRFIESTHLPAAMLVLNKDMEGSVWVAYTVVSDEMRKRYFSSIGSVGEAEELFANAMAATALEPHTFKVTIKYGGENSHLFKCEFFNNTYQAIGLITPVL